MAAEQDPHKALLGLIRLIRLIRDIRWSASLETVNAAVYNDIEMALLPQKRARRKETAYEIVDLDKVRIEDGPKDMGIPCRSWHGVIDSQYVPYIYLLHRERTLLLSAKLCMIYKFLFSSVDQMSMYASHKRDEVGFSHMETLGLFLIPGHHQVQVIVIDSKGVRLLA